MKKTAKFYRKNRASYLKKLAYDKKFNSTPGRRKYRASLNRINRKKGTYGNGDGMDVSHRPGGVILEKASVNRSRNEKSRRKGYKQ